MQRGDRFALMLRNHPEFVEAMIAASISATAFVPIDPRSKGGKLAYMLQNSGCKGVVCLCRLLSRRGGCGAREGGRV
jgi:crotonobetaine/carnitine-CoA ligase